MRRRDFITLLGGATLAWPPAAHAQQRRKLPTIGFLGSTNPELWSPWTTAFVRQLHELGWIEDRTVAIAYRWAEGRSQRFAEIAAEFVRLKVDVIVTSGAAALAAKHATTVIPIVFVGSFDPIGSGLVAGLARPGGNATGLSMQATDLAGKRLELLREVIPHLRRVAVTVNSDNPATMLEMKEVEAVARTIGLEIVPLDIRQVEDIAAAGQSLKGRADALYVSSDSLTSGNRALVINAARGAGLPSVFNLREQAEAGGLISYGPDFPDLMRRTAVYVDKILRGARAADLPVEQPTKFDLVINLTTAKALGLTLPEAFLLRADEVIE